MKRKIVATALALVMTLVVGCNFEFSVGDSHSPGDIVMSDGKILLSDFDSITIRKFLEATKEVKDYHIILNTGGGSSLNCMTMINRIQRLQAQGAHITTEIIGYGMSAGTFVFLLGDERIVHEGSILLLHGAGDQVGYERLDARKVCAAPEGREYLCDFLNMLDQSVIDLLREKTIMTDEEINDWLYFEDYNFMSADEAFDLNVATKIVGE
jgi:ATP-dependent protease ClpP protease subunit